MRNHIMNKWPKLSSEHIALIELHTWAYVFRIQYFEDSKAAVSTACTNREYIDFKNIVLNDGELMQAQKIILVMALHHNMWGSNLDKWLRAQGYPDLITTVHLLRSSSYYPTFLAAAKTAYANIGKDNITSILDEIKVWVAKFVRRKLMFIAKSNRWDIADIDNDMTAKAVQTFNYLYPFETGAKLVNTIKRAVHNHGITFIEHHTAKKRARLVKTEDGYTNSQETMLKFGEGETESAVIRDDAEGLVTASCEAVVHEKIFQQQIKNLFGSDNPKYHNAALCLLCYTEPKFLRFLYQKYGSLKGATLSEAQQKLGITNYNLNIRKFYDLTGAELYAVANRLRQEVMQ